MSIELHNGRRTTLPDPGIFDYEMSNPLASVGKRTTTHSTMNVNLGNQVDVDARLLLVEDLPNAVVAQGRYEGSYWTGVLTWRFLSGRGAGVFGSHDRIVVWLKDRAMVVLDSMDHDAHRPAFLHWVSDDVPYEMDGAALRTWTKDPEGNVLIQVCPIASAQVAASVHRGEKDPYLGYIAEEMTVVPAPLFQFAFERPGPHVRGPITTECISILVPFTGEGVPSLSAQARPLDGTMREVVLNWGDGRKDQILYRRRLERPIATAPNVHTDAAMVITSHSPGEPTPQTAMVLGSYLRVEE